MDTLIQEIRQRKSQPAGIVPVIEPLDNDIDPLEAFRRLNGKKAFLLESAERGGKSARYSFVGAGDRSIRIHCGKIVVDGRDIGPYEGGPLAFMKDFMAGFRMQPPVYFFEESFSRGIPSLPPFYGGLAGYVSYDFVRYIDPIGDTAADDTGCADADLLLAEDMIVFDHVQGVKMLVAGARENDKRSLINARERLRAMKESLSLPPVTGSRPAQKPITVSYPTTKEQYMDMVSRSKEYILDGDAFQIVISQRAEIDTNVDRVALYRALKAINPSPYMYFLEFGDAAVVGSSPEILVKVENGQVIVRPIAGTRPRGSTPEKDAALEAEMKADPKEVAEHVMLVDLGRNDVGKVAKFGTVRVDDFMATEKYSHVQHIVSNVVGDLADDKDMIDVLAAAFPAGTVSGAPKTRAMQIIEELEGRRRGLYAGCVGYLSFSGNMDMAIAIRTILLKDGKAYVQAGAGIVMDSEPEKEYVESMNKGAAMIRALEAAAGGKYESNDC
ncbi:MAG: anthranilate synthase component I [Methanocella sp.]